MAKHRSKATLNVRDLAREHPNEFLVVGDVPISGTDLFCSALKERNPHAPLEAGVTLGVPEGQIPCDLRSVAVDDRRSVWVRLRAPLKAGCGAVLVYTNKRFKPRIGRYWPGPPEQFAEFVDFWGIERSEKVSKRKRVSSIAWPMRLVGASVKYPPR